MVPSQNSKHSPSEHSIDPSDFPEGFSAPLQGHRLLDEFRTALSNSGRSTSGRSWTSDVLREQITDFLKTDPTAVTLVNQRSDFQSAAQLLIERYEELCRRLSLTHDPITRVQAWQALVFELDINERTFHGRRSRISDFVPATLLNRKVVASIPAESDFSRFSRCVVDIIEAVVSHPTDPRERLREAISKEDEIIKDPRFESLSRNRKVLRHASLYQTDAERYLTDLLESVAKVKGNPKYSELPDWLIDHSAANYGKRLESFLDRAMTFHEAVMKDEKYKTVHEREWIIYQAYFGSPRSAFIALDKLLKTQAEDKTKEARA